MLFEKTEQTIVFSLTDPETGEGLHSLPSGIDRASVVAQWNTEATKTLTATTTTYASTTGEGGTTIKYLTPATTTWPITTGEATLFSAPTGATGTATAQVALTQTTTTPSSAAPGLHQSGTWNFQVLLMDGAAGADGVLYGSEPIEVNVQAKLE